MLTDGSISNTQTVLDIIERHNHETRVRSFGINSGFSKYLVNEIARSDKGVATHIADKGVATHIADKGVATHIADKGVATHIADKDRQINAKVIKALKHASKPAFTNVSIDWGKNKMAVDLSAPMSSYISNIYEEEPFNLYTILSESKVEETKLRLKFYNIYKLTNKEVIFKLDLDQVKWSDDTHKFQLVAKRYIDVCDRFGGKESSEKNIGISTEYQVL